MTAAIIPFNPLDRQNLGASIAQAMLSRPVSPLGSVPQFDGAGVYAIYYTGDHPAYKELVALNKGGKFGAPVYVGKAVPSGARRGTTKTKTTAKPERPLMSRLNEHRESVKQAAPGLKIDDFFCRFLVVEDIFIPLGESLLIANFLPVWNGLVDGFGNHDPGSGRHKGMASRWDVLHPGRTWVTKLQPRNESALDIERDVETYLRTHLPALKPEPVLPTVVAAGTPRVVHAASAGVVQLPVDLDTEPDAEEA